MLDAIFIMLNCKMYCPEEQHFVTLQHHLCCEYCKAMSPSLQIEILLDELVVIHCRLSGHHVPVKVILRHHQIIKPVQLMVSRD